MSRLLMHTEQTRQLGAHLQQSAREVQDIARRQYGVVLQLAWESSAKGQFSAEYSRILSQLLAVAAELDALGLQVQAEVAEWEQAAAVFGPSAHGQDAASVWEKLLDAINSANFMDWVGALEFYKIGQDVMRLGAIIQLPLRIVDGKTYAGQVKFLGRGKWWREQLFLSENLTHIKDSNIASHLAKNNKTEWIYFAAELAGKSSHWSDYTGVDKAAVIATDAAFIGIENVISGVVTKVAVAGVTAALGALGVAGAPVTIAVIATYALTPMLMDYVVFEQGPVAEVWDDAKEFTADLLGDGIGAVAGWTEQSARAVDEAFNFSREQLAMA